MLPCGSLSQIKVFQLALRIANGCIAVQQRGAGAFQLPVLQLTLLNRLQLGHDLIVSPLIVLELNAGGHGDEALLPVVEGGRVIAEGQLLPDVQKQLGVAGPAKKGITHQQSGHIVTAAGKTHAQLALGHVQHILHILHGFPADVGRRRGDHPNLLAGQGGKGRRQRLLYPFQIGAAAVNNFQRRCGDQIPILGIDLQCLQLVHRLLVAQTGHGVGLSIAQRPQQTAVRPIPLIVDERPDGLQQIGLFAFKILRHKPAVVGDGVTDQLAQQRRRRFQQPFAAGGIPIVNKTGHKAHALVFTFFPHRVIDGGIVEVVHLCGERSHIGTAYRTPPQHRRQQCVGSRRLPPQGRDKLCGKQTGFEFSRRQIGQVDALCQPDACRFQIINSLWTAQAARSMSIQSLLYVKYMNNSNLFLWASPSFLPLCAKSGKTGGLPPVFPHKTILFYSSTRRRFSDAMACRSASEKPIRSSSKKKF